MSASCCGIILTWARGRVPLLLSINGKSSVHDGKQQVFYQSEVTNRLNTARLLGATNPSVLVTVGLVEIQ